MEVATPDWIERMVMYSQMPEVGAVGGRLLWEDGRLQHVVVRFDAGLPGHLYRGFPGDYAGYANDVRVAQNCLAVTGACLMTRRELFERGRRPLDRAAGQLQRRRLLPEAARRRPAGRLRPRPRDVPLRVLEPGHRGRADWEKDLFKERWLPLTAVDPYSNPSLRHGSPRFVAPFLWRKGQRPRSWARRRREKTA